jgi:hypothetical protein
MTTVEDGRPTPPAPQPGGPERFAHRNGGQTARAGPWWWAGRVAMAMRTPPARWLVFLCAGALGVALSAHLARGGALLAERWGLLAELSAWAAAWIAAVAAALRMPRRAAVPLIFVVAIALRLAALAGPPTTTDDFYRYSWDGRVQAAGIDPYRYAPGSESLTALRDPWLWPAVQPCPLAYRPEGCTRINRSAVHTIYPPAAEAWFAAVYRLTGIGARHKPWQVAGLVTDVAVVALLATALRRQGKDPRWCALYALCPAPVLEIVNNGHVDGLAILLSVAALAVASPPAAQQISGHIVPPERDGMTRERVGASPAVRELAAGALIGVAALVKLYPALLVLAVVAAMPARRGRALLRIGGAASAVAVAGYLPHVLRVGTKVIGFLPGYLREEHYDGAGRYLVAGALRVPGGVAGSLSGLALVTALAWVWVRRPSAPVGAAVIMGTLLLAVSPVQPWYAVTLLAFATLAVEPQWAAVVVAGYPYFFAVILLHPQRVGIGQLAYGLAAAGVSVPVLLRGLRTSGRSMRRCPPSGC